MIMRVGGSARDMARQSLNLGWTFPRLALPDRIRAAACVGFRYVECHFPYEHDAAELAGVLRETGLAMVAMNVPRGGEGRLGLASVAGADAAFREDLVRALDWSRILEAPFVHVLAGDLGPEPRAAAEARLAENLAWAATEAGTETTLLVEPLNSHDRPDYLLSRIDQAARIIGEVGRPNVRLLFDAYHVAMMEDDPVAQLARHAGIIAHVQVAGVPGHHEPDEGIVDYEAFYDALDRTGYAGLIGAEYVPRGDTLAGLAWLGELGIVGRETLA